MRWRIFYVDETTFSNADGEPQDAPGGGVLAVAQDDANVGTVIHHLCDFYVFDKQFGGWYGIDVFGLTQYFMKPGYKIVKIAESTTVEKYRALIASLRDDPQLPPKSAHYPWETLL